MFDTSIIMAKNKKRPSQPGQTNKPTPATSPKSSKQYSGNPWFWLAGVVLIAAICFYPMLSNQFTNWDDLFYVLENKLLIGPDYKNIFDLGHPVVSNYHPLTVLSLAFNYQATQLQPSSYLLTNYILHLINCVLVFWFIRELSKGNSWVAGFTALVFAIHPMHVESVAWVSERKDVLYTLFFLLSLISYLMYRRDEKIIRFVACNIFFVLSLLSKPAAIVLPLVLVAIDVYEGRGISSKSIIQKLPAFILAAIFAIITLKIQSAKAVSSLDSISLAVRPLYACYALMIYAWRFFVPYPLSAYHPYPPMDNMGWPVYISPLVVLALVAAVWRWRKDRVVLFAALFYVINLLLVLQIVSFGNTIVSERYTYVPYIGLAFLVGSVLSRLSQGRVALASAAVIVALGFGYVSFERTHVWHDSDALWTDVLSHYPYTSVPRTNRANYISTLAADPAYASRADAMNRQSLADCDTALRVDPKHIPGYRIRGIVLLRLNRPAEALKDAEQLKILAPTEVTGYSVGGTANLRLGHGPEALADFNKALQITPNDAEILNSRGTTLFNLFKRYNDALADFNLALSIKQDGGTYLNRSRCYYMLGDREKAQADARRAQQLHTPVGADYLQLIGLNS